MKFAVAIVAGVALSSAALAGELVTLKGADIETALNDRTVEGIHNGTAWTQEFRKSGVTVYVSRGRTDTGSWLVRGDTYCSNWPPSETWECYAVSTDGEAVNFTPPGGAEAWPSRYAK